MKATYQVSPSLQVELEASDVKDLFRELSGITEVLGHKRCGKCGGQDISPQVRTVGKYTYHELRCQAEGCGATLAFGVQEGSEALFPKRYETGEDGEKTWLPNGGWCKYDKKSGKRV